jgi:hypothetical protein
MKQAAQERISLDDSKVAAAARVDQQIPSCKACAQTPFTSRPFAFAPLQRGPCLQLSSCSAGKERQGGSMATVSLTC